MKKKLLPYIVSIAVALGVGGLSALLTRGSMDIYETLKTPPLSPPSVLFPIVWSVLYILMGISAAKIWTDPFAFGTEKRSALWTYGISLAVNFLWSIIFFNMRAFGLAFFWLLLLLLLVIRTIMKYYPISPKAALLQIPYALWVTFAGYLTLGIWILNK